MRLGLLLLLADVSYAVAPSRRALLASSAAVALRYEPRRALAATPPKCLVVGATGRTGRRVCAPAYQQQERPPPPWRRHSCGKNATPVFSNHRVHSSVPFLGRFRVPLDSLGQVLRYTHAIIEAVAEAAKLVRHVRPVGRGGIGVEIYAKLKRKRGLPNIPLNRLRK